MLYWLHVQELHHLAAQGQLAKTFARDGQTARVAAGAGIGVPQIRAVRVKRRRPVCLMRSGRLFRRSSLPLERREWMALSEEQAKQENGELLVDRTAKILESELT